MSLHEDHHAARTRGRSPCGRRPTTSSTTCEWGSIDTVVNSPTFGQVTSVRSMRSVTFSIRAGF
ncbi:MAG: hypothetical protein MZV63_23820 [Marinilabiliales bacterium]|nr:hypothetical protein [Marinilabiliales bacterium]